MNKILDEFKTKSQSVIQTFKKESGALRTNRPSPALLEDLKVNCYNQVLHLKQVGSINIVPPREINIQVWDKSIIGETVKAIETSPLGVSVNVDGNLIKVYLPELSQERREEIARHVKKLAEQFRIQLRNLRDESTKNVQKSFETHEINEDQKFKLKEEIQKAVDESNKEIETILESKIKEIET